MKQAIIDIGSNSIRLTLYETEGQWSTCVKDFRNIRHKIASKQFIFDN